MDSIRGRCVSTLEIVNDVRNSSLLSNILKRCAGLLIELLQVELQKMIFENGLYVQFTALEKMEVGNLENAFNGFSTFSLERFVTVL